MKRDKALEQLMDKCIEAIEHVGVSTARVRLRRACVRHSSATPRDKLSKVLSLTKSLTVRNDWFFLKSVENANRC